MCDRIKCYIEIYTFIEMCNGIIVRVVSTADSNEVRELEIGWLISNGYLKLECAADYKQVIEAVEKYATLTDVKAVS